MIEVTRSEVLLVAFIFALVWSAGALPRFGERIGARVGARGRRDGA